MAWKHKAYQIHKSYPGHTRLKQQWKKDLQISFVRPSKNSDRKEEKKKEKRQKVSDDLGVWPLNLLLEVNILPSLVSISLVKVKM